MLRPRYCDDPAYSAHGAETSRIQNPESARRPSVCLPWCLQNTRIEKSVSLSMLTRHTPRYGPKLEQNQNPRAPISSIMILPRICSKRRHLRKIKAAVAKPEIKIQNRESCVGARGETRKSRIQNHKAPGKSFQLKRENSEFRIKSRRCKQGRSARIQSSESRRRLARV